MDDERGSDKRKMVVFVAGTAYSGSTLLAMILGNDPMGFSCGEPRNYLNPTQPYHPTLECGCKNESCTLWNEVRRAGSNRLYETIFTKYPEVEFIVDSSKNPFWIRNHTLKLTLTGIDVKTVLIWKSPLEIALSYNKRQRLDQWKKSWINYHRLFFSLIPEWRSISYSQLVKDERGLEIICGYLNIPCVAGKRNRFNLTLLFISIRLKEDIGQFTTKI
jgi:hypothetical protein